MKRIEMKSIKVCEIEMIATTPYMGEASDFVKMIEDWLRSIVGFQGIKSIELEVNESPVISCYFLLESIKESVEELAKSNKQTK